MITMRVKWTRHQPDTLQSGHINTETALCSVMKKM